MKFLITGGAGFLGINLIRYLLNRGHLVRSLDLADFDYPEKSKVEIIRGDIRDKKVVVEAMKDVDVVVHCAAALPLYKKADIFSADVFGTKNILEEAEKSGASRVIYISSAAVYGVLQHCPIFENDRLKGAGPYGEAKILAEAACLMARKRGMCVSVIRPVTFIGPERLGIFSLLYDWAREGRDFPVLGRGDNRYQLLDVEDLCEAVYLCAVKDKKIVNDTFNIGAKKFTAIKQDFQSILDQAGFGKKIRCFPARPMIMILKTLNFFHLSPLYGWIYKTAGRDFFVSIEKAEKILGFAPQYSNQEALARNYQWYLNNYSQLAGQAGISHRVPWKQGILKWIKIFF